MLNTVALTDRQRMFFNYFKEYQQQHGFFPTPSQAERDLRAQGVKCSAPSIETMFGNLFLKGAFTGGQALSWGNRYRSSATSIPALDISKLNFKAKASGGVVNSLPSRPVQQNNPLDGIDLNKLRALLAAL